MLQKHLQCQMIVQNAFLLDCSGFFSIAFHVEEGFGLFHKYFTMI